MADEVVAEVHRHEAGELEEARINLPPRARIDIGTVAMTFFSNQAKRPLRRDRVDLGRRLAGVDRPAHHGQRLAAATGFLSAPISAVAAKAGTDGLAHGEHVRRLPVLADMLEELDQIIDVIVEIEAARRSAAPASRRASR